jgi:hypothetical protein
VTEYELLDVIATFQATATGHLMNFITVLFAYLVCAFLVGEQLTRLQIWMVNFLYSIFAFTTIVLCYLAWDRYIVFTNRTLEQYPQPNVLGEGGPPDGLAFLIVSILVWGYIAGLLFMWTKRRAQA